MAKTMVNCTSYDTWANNCVNIRNIKQMWHKYMYLHDTVYVTQCFCIYIYILCRYIPYIKYNHIYCIYNFINNFIYIYMSDLCRYLHVQISAMFIMCHGHHVSSNIIRKKYYWRIWFIFIYHQFPDIVLIHSETI